MTVDIQRTRLFNPAGVRFAFGKELLDTALNLGLACGRLYPYVIVGQDTRTSSDLLKHAVISGLLASGASVQDAGIVPTPTLALAAGKVDLAMLITASHNPPEDNGIKLLKSDGAPPDSDELKRIEEMMQEDGGTVAGWSELSTVAASQTCCAEHARAILQRVNLESRPRVAVDCCCGAAYYLTPSLLTRLGCKVLFMNCHPSGFPPRGVEPVEENLADLKEAVLDSCADVGIAHDIDADRMMVIDDRGRFVPGDLLMALFARELNYSEIITSVDSSMVLEELGLNVSRTRVGDVYISRELKTHGGFGGEPSGSWVFPELSLCPDGIYAAALITQIASRRKLSDLVDELPRYPLTRRSINSDGILLADLEERLLSTKPLSVCRTDGLKLVYTDGWLLVRSSRTEPKLRITIEVKTESRLRELLQHVQDSLIASGVHSLIT